MAMRYPAVFIGGPPHAGKSWLTHQLSRALARRQVAHYVLRAHPDGEGHWRFEAPADAANELRLLAKQPWTPEFAARISRDIAGRHLPLLVDAGGQVSEETRLILAHCSGAILLAPRRASLAAWRALVAEQALPLLAELRSTLDGPQTVDAAGATLRGTISGLGPGRAPSGPCFDQLVVRLDGLCRFERALLLRQHAALLDADPLDIEAPIGALPAHRMPDAPWRPDELPQLLAAVDPRAPLAIYGAGPPWLYAALAAYTAPAPLQVFNVALGWVQPPPLALGDKADAARLAWQRDERETYTRLRFTIPGAYLDYAAALAAPLRVPRVAPDRGVALDGRLPTWLYAALARRYASAAWVGVYEPRADPPAAIVVRSRRPQLPIGSVYPLAPEDA